MRRPWPISLILAVLAFLLSLSAYAHAAQAEPAASQPAAFWAAKAPMGEVIQRIRTEEAWIWEASSLLVRFKADWRKSTESVQLSLAELGSKRPDLNFNDPQTQRILLGMPPTGEEQLLLAWDQKRLAWFDDKSGVSSDHGIFDGQQAKMQVRHLDTGQEYCSLDKTPRKVGAAALSALGMGRIAWPSVWWSPFDETARSYLLPPLSACQDHGVVHRDGKPYRLISRHVGPAKQELWVNAETGHIERLKAWAFPPVALEEFDRVNAARARALMTAMVESFLADEAFQSAAEAVRGRMDQSPDWLQAFATKFESARVGEILRESPGDYSSISAKVWLELLRDEGLLGGQFEAIQNGAARELQARPALLVEAEDRAMETLKRQTGFGPVPQSEYVFLDWREAAPGKLFPFHQVMTVFAATAAKAGVVDLVRSMEVIELAVDKPLPDDLFAMEFKEGAQVYDWGHVPPLFYQYKKTFTEEEWGQILKQAEDLEKRKQEIADQRLSLVGKPAPAIRAEKWLNTEPLDWTQLRGKLTVLHFFAEWSPASVGEIPRILNWRKEHPAEGLVFLGVHAAAASDEKLNRLIQERAIEYPIAIDQPIRQGASWGETFANYRVTALPRCVLVDGEGKVALEGALDEVLAEAVRRVEKE